MWHYIFSILLGSGLFVYSTQRALNPFYLLSRSQHSFCLTRPFQGAFFGSAWHNLVWKGTSWTVLGFCCGECGWRGGNIAAWYSPIYCQGDRRQCNYKRTDGLPFEHGPSFFQRNLARRDFPRITKLLSIAPLNGNAYQLHLYVNENIAFILQETVLVPVSSQTQFSLLTRICGWLYQTYQDWAFK